MFNCSCCEYKSKKKYNFTRHMMTKHKEHKNDVINNNINNNQTIKCDEYIYLFKEREFIKTNEPIYKIGKTKQPCLTRLKNYPNGTILLFQINCKDCDAYEKILISKFKEKFIQIKDLGNEYFKGNYFEMIEIIYNLIWEKDIKDGINAYNNNTIDNNNDNNDNKCIKCNKILSSKRNLDKHLLICKGVLNPFECHLCHKILANSGSKSRHLKICKGLSIKEHSTELIVLNNDDNNNDIIIFDPLKPYGTTLKTEHIDLEFISNLLKIKEKDALTLYTQKILDNPENRCIKKTNLHSLYSQIYNENNKWEYCYDKDIYPKFINEISNSLKNLLLLQNLDKIEINKLIEFIDHIIKDNKYKEQIKKTKLIIYNLRDLMK